MDSVSLSPKEEEHDIIYLPQQKKSTPVKREFEDDIEINLLPADIDPRFKKYEPAQIQQLYQYWYQKGFFGIILQSCIKLMFPKPQSVGENFFVFVFSVIVVYWVKEFLMLFVTAYRSWQTKLFFQRLMGTRDVTDLTWQEVIAAIKKEYGERFVHDELDIVNAIMITENFMMALINEEKLDFKVPFLSCCFHLELITMALEYGLKRSFSPIFDKIKKTIDYNYEEDVSTLRWALIKNGMIGLFLSPIMAVVVFIFVLFEYGEQFKSSPGQLLGFQDWSLLAKYKFRDYNELPHLFEARMKKTYKPVTEFLDNKVSDSFVSFARFLSFQVSSVVFILVCASFYDPDFLTKTKLIGDLNALVLIGTLGTVLAGLRKIIPSERTVYEPKNVMLQLSSATHYYPKRWIGQEHTATTLVDLKRLYPYSFATFFWEMLGIFIAPLQMIAMSRNAGSIIQYMMDITVQYNNCAFYTKHSCFRKKKTKYEDGSLDVLESGGILFSELEQYPYKVAQSIASFRMEYPLWDHSGHLDSFFVRLQNESASRILNFKQSFADFRTTYHSSSLVRNSNLERTSIPVFGTKKGNEKEKESYSKTISVIRIDKELNKL